MGVSTHFTWDDNDVAQGRTSTKLIVEYLNGAGVDKQDSAEDR